LVADGDFRRPYFYPWSRRCGFGRAQLPYKSCPEKLCDRPAEAGSGTGTGPGVDWIFKIMESEKGEGSSTMSVFKVHVYVPGVTPSEA
jgi:hypothetical protein